MTEPYSFASSYLATTQSLRQEALHFGAAFIMDEILYKQLHASINHIMENPAKLPETGKATGGGDIERGYLHQCVAQLQPLPDDDSKPPSPASKLREPTPPSTSVTHPAPAAPVPASSSPVCPIFRPPSARGSTSMDEIHFPDTLAKDPPHDAEKVRQMLARLDTGHLVAHLADGDSDVSEGSEDSDAGVLHDRQTAGRRPCDADYDPRADEGATEEEGEEEEEGGKEIDDGRMEEEMKHAERRITFSDATLCAASDTPTKEGANETALDAHSPEAAVSSMKQANLATSQGVRPPAGDETRLRTLDLASDVLNETLMALESDSEGDVAGMEAEDTLAFSVAGVEDQGREDDVLHMSTRATASGTQRTELCLYVESDDEEDDSLEAARDHAEGGAGKGGERQGSTEDASGSGQQEWDDYFITSSGKDATQVPLPPSPPLLPPALPPDEGPFLVSGLKMPGDIHEADIGRRCLSRAPAYPPPLTVVARVRAYLTPSSPSHVSTPAFRGSAIPHAPTPSQPQSSNASYPHLTVVNEHRLVLVNPEVFENARPDAVLALVAALNRASADGRRDSLEWARAFELDRAYWSGNSEDNHSVDQAALYSDLGRAMEHEVLELGISREDMGQDSLSNFSLAERQIMLSPGFPATSPTGINVVCFAFGATKSGKTYTLFGPEEALFQDRTLQTHPDLGLAPRILAKMLSEQKANAAGFSLSISALEISVVGGLQDLLLDLNAPTIGPLRIREHPDDGPYVEHLTIEAIPTVARLQQVLVALTSSRRRAGGSPGSHMLLTAYIHRFAESDALISKTQMLFVELASSLSVMNENNAENARRAPSKTSSFVSSSPSSPRRRYTSSLSIDGKSRQPNTIQQSLTALGTMLKHLGKGEDVAFLSRASAITWLTRGALADPTGGHAYLLLCLDPTPGGYHDALHALHFGEPLCVRRRSKHDKTRRPDTSIYSKVDLGTPVRDCDIQDWSIAQEDFGGLVQRLSGGRKENMRHVLKETVSDPKQRLERLKESMGSTMAADLAAQVPLDSEDDEEDGQEGHASQVETYDTYATEPLCAHRSGTEPEETNPSRPHSATDGQANTLSPLPPIPAPGIAEPSNKEAIALKTRLTELQIQLQSMRVDRDVAQSDSRLAQEELQRFKRQELTAKSQRIHELENALTTLRHEYQELELSNRQLENDRGYLRQLLDETKASHAQDLQRLETRLELLQKEKNEWESRNPHLRNLECYDQLQQQLSKAEHHGRQAAQELQESTLQLDKAKLDAAENMRKNTALQEEINSLRLKFQQQQSASANVEALQQQHQQQRFELMDQLRVKDAALSELRRESCRIARSLHDRVLTLERLAAHADGWALRDGLRSETSALGAELRRWIEKSESREGNASFASPRHESFYASPTSFARYDHGEIPKLQGRSPVSVVDSRLSGVNECLRQENTELKEKLRTLESRDATKSLVETLLSGINKQQQQQQQQQQQYHGGNVTAETVAVCNAECASEDENSISTVHHYQNTSSYGSRGENRSKHNCCDEEDGQESEYLGDIPDLSHQLQMEEELACARQEALRLQHQNRALLGELEDLDKLLIEAESDGINLLSSGSRSASKSKSSPSKKEQKQGSTKHTTKGVANIESVVKEQVNKALAGLVINGTSHPINTAPVAQAPKMKQQDKTTKHFLQLLEKKRRNQQRTGIPFTSAPAAKLPTPSFRGGFAAPRERETRKGKTEWVRESKFIEDWIGSLRSPPAPSAGNFPKN